MIYIMKRFLYLAFLMLTSVVMNAQDKMVLTSGKVVNVKVEEVTNTDLRFRMYDNLHGPILAEKLANIYYVQYEDGPMRIFNGRPARTRTDNYIPYYSPRQYAKPYSKQEMPPSGLTAQVDLYIQDMWGAGFMLRKEFNQYWGLNLGGASFMSGWKEIDGPKHFGLVNARLGGVRGYLPIVQNLKAYADVAPGYTYVYSYGNKYHFFGVDMGAGLYIHKNIALGYNLTLIVNGSGHVTYHWGRISILF